MNGTTRERIRRRIETLEAMRPEALPVTIEWQVVLPGQDGPVATGEVVAWNAKR